MRHYHGTSGYKLAHFWYEKVKIGWVLHRESTLIGIHPYRRTVSDPKTLLGGIDTIEYTLNKKEKLMHEIAVKTGPNVSR